MYAQPPLPKKPYFMQVSGLSGFLPKIVACDLIRTTNHKNTIGQAVFKENKLSRDYHITVKGKQSRGIFVMLKIRE